MTRALAGTLAAALLLGLGWPGHAEGKNPLVRTVGSAEVDWEAGTVSVRAGAAADLRLPGPEAARPAARRAAEKAGAASLAEALQKVNLRSGRRFTAAEATAAAAHAKVTDVEYQSNGGVLLTLEVGFGDLTPPSRSELEAKVTGPKGAREKAEKVPAENQGQVDAERAPPEEPLELTLAVASMPLEVAPRVYSGGLEHTLGTAVYRLGEAPKAARKVYSAKRDRQGRLTFAAPAAVIRQLDGAHATIFLRSVGK
jgi:hypothetical protein